MGQCESNHHSYHIRHDVQGDPVVEIQQRAGDAGGLQTQDGSQEAACAVANHRHDERLAQPQGHAEDSGFRNTQGRRMRGQAICFILTLLLQMTTARTIRST